MRAFLFSDSHSYHNLLNIRKDIDCAIFCGDASNSRNPHINEDEVYNFLDWFADLDIQHKIMTWGNHDTSVEAGLIDTYLYDIHILNHESVTIEGIKFFGSPYTPTFGDWAFMKKRSRMDLIWETVPDDIDVLITHGPPKGILDLAYDIHDRTKLVQVGCKALYNRVQDIRPRYHVFGHIHSDRKHGLYNNGILSIGDTTYINCSCLDHKANELSNGFVIDIVVPDENSSETV